MNGRQKLIDILKAELEFVEQGGYRGGPRYPFRPNFIFEDSPTCINYRREGPERRTCEECHLLELVPQERREARFPCRHIQLTEKGDTVHSFYEYGTAEELEAAVAAWLKTKIRELEEERHSRTRGA